MQKSYRGFEERDKNRIMRGAGHSRKKDVSFLPDYYPLTGSKAAILGENRTDYCGQTRILRIVTDKVPQKPHVPVHF